MSDTFDDKNDKNKIELDVFLKQTLESSTLSFGIFKNENGEIVTEVISTGFKSHFSKDREISKNSLFGIETRLIHQDDISGVKEKTSKFIESNEDLDFYFRLQLSNNSIYHSIHALGKHVKLEGDDFLFVWYNDLAVTDDDSFLFDERSYDNTVRMIKNYYDDELTGLPRMANFVNHVDELLSSPFAENKQYIILSFDLTGMKAYNMKFGFEKGDRLIVAVSDLLKTHFESQLVSRFGEDHFYVLAENIDIEKTLHEIFIEAKKINDGDSLPLRVGIYKDKITNVSIACDKAKTAADVGRHSYVSHFTYFDEKLTSEIEKRDYILNNIDEAIEKGYIRPYYQPIVRTLNSQVADEEALARWEDPKKGLLSPADFIPILESARLIYKLDLCILDHVLADLKRKEEKGQFITPVSINISRYDFESCDIVKLVSEKVKASGYSSDRIIIEITESAAFYNKALLIAKVNRFHEAGFKVWVDDFGSGYSSLNSLQDFSFDGMKIDMGFLSSFKTNSKTPNIIRETIKLAEKIGIDTICEGVETKEELDFLREAGCDKVQGYYFSKPNPIEYILSGQTPLKRENPLESQYYREIALSSLSEPENNGDTGTVAERALSGPSVGIIEILGNKLKLLRATNAFKRACQIEGFISTEQDYEVGYSFIKEADSFFTDTIRKACETGNWEETSYRSEHRTTTFFFRLISTNPVNNAKSVMCIVSYANKGTNLIDDKENVLVKIESVAVEDLPYPVAIMKVIRGEDKESIRCLVLNKAFSDLISMPIAEVKKDGSLEKTFDSNGKWKTLFKRVLTTRRVFKGEFFNDPSRIWMNYIISPCIVEDCVSLTILKEKDNSSLFEKQSINCDDEAYRIASILKLKEDRSKKINDALSEFGRSSNVDDALIVELNGDKISERYEWNKDTFSSLSKTIVDNEFDKVFKKLKVVLKERHFYSIKSIEEIKTQNELLYDWCRKHGVKRFMIYPLTSKAKIVGFFVANNYELNNAVFTKKLMEKVSGIFAAEICLKKNGKNKENEKHKGFSIDFGKNVGLKTTFKNIFGTRKRSASEHLYNDRSNIEIGRLTSLFLALFEAVFAIFFIIYVNGQKEIEPNNVYYQPTWIWTHMALYAFAFVVHASFFVYSELYYHDKLTKVKNISIKTRTIIDIYVICVNIFGILISVMDIQNGGQSIMFITMLLYTFFVFRIYPVKTFIYTFFLEAAFIFLVRYVPLVDAPIETLHMEFDIGVLLNLICVYLLLCVSTTLLYKARLRAASHCLIDSLSTTKCRFALQEDYKHLSNKNIVVMMLDIDDFKLLNDIHGHAAGDAVINEVGKALVNTFGIESVYRYGGDEFLIIKKGDLFSFEKRLYALQNNINDMITLDMNVTFSAGYKEHFVKEGDSLDEIIRESDLLLYEAKKRGKNQIVKG